MNTSSKLLSDSTGEPIVDASITVTDLNGESYNVGTTSNEKGEFTVDPAWMDWWDDTLIEVSRIGFKTLWFHPDSLPKIIRMDADVKELGEVVVTAKKKPVPEPRKPNYLVPALLAAGSALAFTFYFVKS